MLHIIADKKTTQFIKDLGEQEDVSSVAYWWCRGGFFWHIRANLGLVCAQAAALCTQVVGNSHWRSARFPVIDPGWSLRSRPRK